LHPQPFFWPDMHWTNVADSPIAYSSFFLWALGAGVEPSGIYTGS
jgi:hypothetical protein